MRKHSNRPLNHSAYQDEVPQTQRKNLRNVEQIQLRIHQRSKNDKRVKCFNLEDTPPLLRLITFYKILFIVSINRLIETFF